ncbi:MAG: coproporphyrinogen dehydrogenase HemZ [Tissierellia bacterium]|nr:coproporphyrinogen dehydrogenase HemZ [Tissierellia bacterium]
MIKVYGRNEGETHELFELLRILYPLYETDDQDIILEIKDNHFSIRCGDINYTYPLSIYKSTNDIKRLLLEDISLPNKEETIWGTLIGIRPTKLVYELLKSKSPQEVDSILKNEYRIKKFGRELLLDIVDVEEEKVGNISPDSYSVYLHIPFCPTKCEYCSYPTIGSKKGDLVREYVKILLDEIFYYKNKFKHTPKTIYIGGGTPSAIPSDDLHRISEALIQIFGKPLEYTVECGRPDTISTKLIQGLHEIGVNRISINPQSMIQSTLDVLGRSHTIEDIHNAYTISREAGIQEINMDLILGLPGESPEIFLHSLDQVIQKKPDNITIHSLSIKNGAKFWEKKKVSPFHYKEILHTTVLAKDLLKDHGYRPYYMYRQKRTVGNGVNIGYTLTGKASMYNILMMEERQTILGLGMSSTTKFLYPNENRIEKIYQYKNLKDYKEHWMKRQEKKDIILQDFDF